MRSLLVGVLALTPFAGIQEPEPAEEHVSVWVEAEGENYTLESLPDSVDRKSQAALVKWLGHLSESDVPYTAEVLEGGHGVFVFAPELVVEEKKEKKGKGSTRADRRRKLDRERREREAAEAERRRLEGPPPPPEEVRREHLKSVRDRFASKLPAPKTQYPLASAWARETKRARGEVPVLILVRDRTDFHRVLDGVLESNPYLETLVKNVKASKVTGVIIESPLLGVVIQQPKDAEEYRPDHELAKRQVELLLFKRYGPLPFFAREGLSWYFEWEEYGELRTFTGRTEFIGVGDPAYEGWPYARNAAFYPDSSYGFRNDSDVMARLRKWRSDSYEDRLAAASYQVARCLVDRHGDQVAEILGRWAADFSEKRGSSQGGTSWSLDPNFMLGAEDLTAGLQGIELLKSVRAYE